MSDLSALIVALEGATGPSMALSRQIARAIGWHRVEPRLAKNKNGYWIKPEDFIGVMGDGSPILDGLHGTECYADPPDFCSSIDAALTLVPEGHVYTLIGNKSASSSFATASNEQTFENPSRGATDAIAICIAALKARQASSTPTNAEVANG